MKKLVLTTLIILVAISPFEVFAGNIFSDADAEFYNDAAYKLPNATGTASITVTSNDDTYTWTVTINFSGLLPNYSYIFQFGVQDQLRDRYDYNIETDASGNIDEQFVIDDLDNTFQNIQYPPEEHNPLPDYVGYTILRLLDLKGKSGGIRLKRSEPNNEYPDDNPYKKGNPRATMVMRARQDCLLGKLVFANPEP